MSDASEVQTVAVRSEVTSYDGLVEATRSSGDGAWMANNFHWVSNVSQRWALCQQGGKTDCLCPHGAHPRDAARDKNHQDPAEKMSLNRSADHDGDDEDNVDETFRLKLISVLR